MGGAARHDVEIAVHGSSAVVRNLDGGLTWLRVRAVSCAGASEWSKIEELYGTNASDWEDVSVPTVEEGDEAEPCPEDLDTPDNSPATGAATISGTAQVGETLTADTSSIEDTDGLENVIFSYQWLAADSAIRGAMGSTYTLEEADEGKAIKVEVSFTDDAGNKEELTSATTDAVAAATLPNNPATGAPTINGTAQVGGTLTADTSGIADEDGLEDAVFSYQWLADDDAIAGATDNAYTLAAADEGKTIGVRVSFSDDAGNGETLTSVATAAVAAARPLTASFENVPGTHNGTDDFTFELRFSEEFAVSFRTLRDAAFEVTGGSVTGARRLVQGSNTGWEIRVRPDSDADVTVVLPATSDCGADGAICTADDKLLSNRLEETISGPSE